MKLALFLLAASLWGQDAVTLSAPAPAAIASAGAAAQGPARGSSPIWYWVVVRYPIGTAQPSTPAMVPDTVGAGNLSGTNFVRVSWLAMPGATGYDVLRSTTPTFPGPCSACAVVLNTSSLTVDDTGGALSAYPPGGVLAALPATAEFTLNNRDEDAPYINVRILGGNFRLGLISAWTAGNCVQYLAGGKLGDSGFPCGSGGGGGGNVFGGTNLLNAGRLTRVLSNGTITEIPGLVWDAVNGRLGLGTASPSADITIGGGAGTARVITFDPGVGWNARINSSRTTGALDFVASVGLQFVNTGSGVASLTYLSSGPVGIGPSNTSPTGTLHVRNAAAGGSTLVTVQAGDTQSGNLTEWKNNAGTVQAFVTGTGYFNFAGGFIGGGLGKIDLNYYGGRLGLSSDYPLTFSSTTAANGAVDLGLARSPSIANTLLITNGSSNLWGIGGAGIQCLWGDGNSAACDVGVLGARVRNVLATGTVTGATLISGPEFRTTGSNWKLTDSSGSSFGLMQFGGTTSSFPALKRNAAILETKLADDSAYAQHRASGFLVPGGSNAICADGTTGTCGISGGGAGSFQSNINDFKPGGTATTLTTQAGRLAKISKPATTFSVASASGNGSYVIYGTDSGSITYSISSAVTLTTPACTTGCTFIQETTPDVPEGMFEIGRGTITAGVFGTPSDNREWVQIKREVNGLGMNVQCSAGVCVNQVDPAVVQVKNDNVTPTAQFDASAATLSRPFRSLASDPATPCTTGDSIFNTTSNVAKICYSGVWNPLGSSSSGYRVVHTLPFAATDLNSSSVDRFWTFSQTLNAGRNTGDQGCPANSGLKECGVRWLNLTDGTQTWATTTVWMPGDWTSGAVAFRLMLGSGFSSFTPTFELRTGCVANGSPSPSYNPPQTLTPAMVTGNVYVASITNVTTTGCGGGRPIILQLTRTDVGVANQVAVVISAAVEIQVP